MLHIIPILAAIASLTFAAPASQGNELGEFSVYEEAPVERDTLDSRRARVPLRARIIPLRARGFNPFYKYPSPDSSSTLERRGTVTGSVNALPNRDVDTFYISNVTAGGSRLRLVFDTGAAHLWAYSSLQPAGQTKGHQIYNVSKSTTKKLLSGQTWGNKTDTDYGVSGTVYADKVIVGPITATSQAVQAVTSAAAGQYNDTTYDGVFGLAFKSQSDVKPTKQAPFFDTIRAQLKQAVFAADLKHQAPGSWDFGYLNATKRTGAITFVPVNNRSGNSTGLWGFTPGGYAVGTNKTITGSQGLTVADTGTTLATSSTEAVQAYYKQIKGTALVLADDGRTYRCFPCSTTPPDFHTSIGGRTFTVPGRYFTFLDIGPVTSGGEDYCIGSLQDFSSEFGYNIYGLAFLKAFYVVFNQTQSTPTLGFATKNLIT